MVSFMKKVLLALALALPVADALQSLSGRALASPRRSLSRPYRSAGVRVVSATVMAAGGAPLKVGIVGATGAVGAEIIGCLETREFPCDGPPVCFGSSGGKTVATANWGDITTEKFSVDAVTGFDVVFLAASGDFAEEYADAIGAVLAEGGVVVDNSSALRYKDGVPLVVPEVNGDQCEGASVIANPNCTTAIALMALYPLFKEFGLKKVIVSTYQAASGAGAAGMAELRDGVAMASTEGEKYVDSMGRFKEKANGYTKEEMKVTWECRKILGFPPIPDAAADAKLDTAPPKVSCTAVRIPTLRAHSEAITIETVKPRPPNSRHAPSMVASSTTRRRPPSTTDAVTATVAARASRVPGSSEKPPGVGTKSASGRNSSADATRSADELAHRDDPAVAAATAGESTQRTA
ncbi:aspartate-semialdehyde dehydrogenase [Aureococcus anophagefferens]|nr:aspartate-semialdehyde dehydrogenase [Aureococcus anophagefferens]